MKKSIRGLTCGSMIWIASEPISFGQALKITGDELRHVSVCTSGDEEYLIGFAAWDAKAGENVTVLLINTQCLVAGIRKGIIPRNSQIMLAAKGRIRCANKTRRPHKVIGFGLWPSHVRTSIYTSYALRRESFLIDMVLMPGAVNEIDSQK